MAEIIVFDGYSVPKFSKSSASKTAARKGSTNMAGKTKFKQTAKKCNKLKGKAKRKSCWRRAYGHKRR